jgi:hypothetical protein
MTKENGAFKEIERKGANHDSDILQVPLFAHQEASAGLALVVWTCFV